jgi:type I restriction enzyme, R subunit
MADFPEKKFQKHLADYFVRENNYAVLEQAEITDREYYFAEDHFYAFLKASQKETLQNLVNDYGNDARDEIFKALKDEIKRRPLWSIFRGGLTVRGRDFKLYFPKPRSAASVANQLYAENRISFRPNFYFGVNNQEIDFVFFLNGLPIVTLELKHEKNQVVHDAVAQYVARNQSDQIFQLPFLHIAADTSDVQVATDPGAEQNFRWFNSGLTNQPQTEGEYPIEYLYREVLSKDSLLEAIAFYLVRAPKQEAKEDRPEHPAYSIFPRYHQRRCVEKVAQETQQHFAENGDVGRKFLINHSAGSGKTLTMCWMADRLHSLFKPETSEKMLNMIFLLTDRISLDKNIREDMEKLYHLKNVVRYAKHSGDLGRFLREREPIIVTTQQKFNYILEQIENDEGLKKLRVAFLIDEAHRSQEGSMAGAVRKPFRNAPDTGDGDGEIEAQDEINKIIAQHDLNQLFVAFTATPSPATIQLFGKPFDTYSEAEAIEEGYIVDVAESIISYKTLYNLECRIMPLPHEKRLFTQGVVAKALKNVAFQDTELIQYKAEVMLRIYEEQIRQRIDGKAKAMIVTTSRLAGLEYFRVVKEKLKERKADYKVLYAFTDFNHPESNVHYSEHLMNGLNDGEVIEDRFKEDSYRLMIVAGKFQTGFDQPLLTGMFLDKAVADRNAVQTISRLNRCHLGKEGVVVVDFTNNATNILKAFNKYRHGTPHDPDEPEPQKLYDLYNEILALRVFTQEDALAVIALIEKKDDASLQNLVSELRMRFFDCIVDVDERKSFVYLLAKFVKNYHFLHSFFGYEDKLREFAAFCEYVGPQLIKTGSVSELMKLVRATIVHKSAVIYEGVKEMPGGLKKSKPRKTGGGGTGAPPKKVSVQEMIDKIKDDFNISDEEALHIREVSNEKIEDLSIQQIVVAHKNDQTFLDTIFKGQVNGYIQDAYSIRTLYDELGDSKYTDKGAIFDIMAFTVIQKGLELIRV